MCLRQDQGVRKNFTSKIVFSIIAILLVLFTCLAVYGVMEWREREDARKAAEMGGLLDCLKDTAFREGRLDVSAAVAVD